MKFDIIVGNPPFGMRTDIHTDEELLTTCGFTPEEIEKMMDYLKHFDFSKNRNDVVRRNINIIKKILV